MPTGVFLGAYPSPRFAFTRSYVEKLEILGDSNDVDVSGDQYTMWIDRPTGYGVTYILNSYIKPWSSNGYTLDHVVYDCWWHYGFDGIHHPQAFTVNCWPRGSFSLTTLTLVQPLAGTASYSEYLPSSPANYWLNNPDLGNFS